MAGTSSWKARDVEVTASSEKAKAWVAKVSKKSSVQEDSPRRPREVEPAEVRGAWRPRAWSDPLGVVEEKAEAIKGEVYTRDLLLQFNPACRTPSTRSTSAASESPSSSPRSLGSAGGLYCAPLEEVQRRNSEDYEAEGARPRARTDSSMVAEERTKVVASVMSDSQTTVVLKGVPAGYTRTAFCERLAKHGFGHVIDFLHLPMHEEKNENAGCAIINLRTQDACRSLEQLFQNEKASTCLPDFPGDLVCEVSASEIQGLDRNFENLCTPENFGLWHKQGEIWQPLFLDARGVRMPLGASVKTLAGNRPRSVSDQGPAPAYPATLPMPTPAMVLQFMQMRQMQAQMQLQMMQKQMLWQQKMTQGMATKKKGSKGKVSASSPVFETELRAEAPEFVPSI